MHDIQAEMHDIQCKMSLEMASKGVFRPICVPVPCITVNLKHREPIMWHFANKDVKQGGRISSPEAALSPLAREVRSDVKKQREKRGLRALLLEI